MLPTSQKHWLGLAFVFAFALTVSPFCRSALAQEIQANSLAGDGLALSHLFSEQHVDSSCLQVHRQALLMDGDARYDFLRDWVLPNGRHVHFRVAADFLPCDPPPMIAAWGPGSRLVSPALDLVDISSDLNRRSELRDEILRSPVHSPEDLAGQTALLALIAMADADLKSSESLLQDLFGQSLAGDGLREQSRDVVLICVERARLSADLAPLLHHFVYRIVQSYRENWSREVWFSHLLAMHADLLQIVAETDDGNRPPGSPLGLRQWDAVSRTRAFERGDGYPPARWIDQDASVRILSGHSDDYLYFAVPVTGRYSVEAEVTAFDFRESHLSVAGTWIAPVFDHRSFGMGNLRGESGRGQIDPPISNCNDHGWIHYRAVVDGEQKTTFFNGRPIHTERVSDRAFPWIGIRSEPWFDGAVKDLRVTGNPVIPDTIDLAGSATLAGWYEYFDVPDKSELVHWRCERSDEASTGQQQYEIIGPRLESVPRGSHVEQLLVYGRPMLEDGTIEYEFWYDPHESLTHPALGRLCFLLTPVGVREHWITDGIHDRTPIRPDNQAVIDDDVHGNSASLSLQSGQWNRLRLTARGDVIQIQLNGSVVAERPWPVSSDRRFGLFHYADLQQARVRNLSWTGDWPKQLPPVIEQELADNSQIVVQGSDHLVDECTIELDSDAFRTREVVWVKADPDQYSATTADGLVMRIDADDYVDDRVGANLSIGGDFDVTLSYDQLVCQAESGFTSTLMFEVVESSGAETLACMLRERARDGKLIIQCMKENLDGRSRQSEYFSHQPMDATAGRFRLSRRGSTIYYLSAENDSTQFRIIGQADFPRADLKPCGIRFGVKVDSPDGQVEARFKKLHVRAEQIHGVAMDHKLQARLASLDQSRSQLPPLIDHDFAASAPPASDFIRWSDLEPWAAGAGGLLITSHGADQWAAAGFGVRRTYAGDFDTELRFNVKEFPVPARDRRTQVYLQIELADAEQSQVSAIFTRTDRGTYIGEGLLRRTLPGGEAEFRPFTKTPVRAIEQLRVSRRGKRFYLIISEDAHGGDKIIGSVDAGQAGIPIRQTNVQIRTGGIGRMSKVLLKSIEIRAQQDLAAAGRIIE